MIYDKERVYKLKLISYIDDETDCAETIRGRENCNDISCKTCAEVHRNEHYQYICETGKYTCTACKHIRLNLNIDTGNMLCQECEKFQEEYIRGGFKNLFNKLQHEQTK